MALEQNLGVLMGTETRSVSRATEATLATPRAPTRLSPAERPNRSERVLTSQQRRSTLLLVLLAGVPRLLPAAQVPLHTIHGSAPNNELGRAVDVASDIDGDGFDDWLVGSPGDSTAGVHAGSVLVLSGDDAGVLHLVLGPSPSSRFGSSVAGLGDLDGDGFGDFGAGSSNESVPGGPSGAGGARTFAGKSGAVIHVWSGTASGDSFGRAMDSAGDVNADGILDVIVGASGSDATAVDAGSAYVFSGSDGATLLSLHGAASGDAFGQGVSGAGDINGDGYDDVLVGAVAEDGNGIDSGSMRAFSGKDGAVLYARFGDASGDYFGVQVAGAGDLDADGSPDSVAGAWGDDNKGSYSGMVRMFSGPAGTTLFSVDGDAVKEGFGFSVAAAGDTNLDGYADIVAGARQLDTGSGVSFGSGYAKVLSGETGTALQHLMGSVVGDLFGYAVGGGGDIDGDGDGDVIVGAIGSAVSGMNAGSAYAFSGTSTSIGFYGTGCPGTGGAIPKLAITGDASPGGTITVAILDGVGGSMAFLFLGSQQAAIPMGFGCRLNVAPVLAGPLGPLPLFPIGASGPGAGSLSFPAVIPPGVPPVKVTAQAFVQDAGAPGGFANTNGVQLDIP